MAPAARHPARLDPGLTNALRQVRRRLWLGQVARLGVRGLALGAAAAALAAFLPIPFAAGRLQMVLALAAAGPLGAVGIALFQVPPPRQAARLGDRAAGLEERMTTALELAGRGHPLQAAQWSETAAALAAVDWREALPIRLSTRWLAAAVVLTMLSAGLLARPVWLSPGDAAELAAVTGAIDQFETALSRTALANAVGFSDEIQSALSQLQIELAAARNREDVQLAIGRATARVDTVAEETAGAALAALAQVPGGALDNLVDRLRGAVARQDWALARQLARLLGQQARRLPRTTEAERTYQQQAREAAAGLGNLLNSGDSVQAAREALEETLREVASLGMPESQRAARLQEEAGDGDPSLGDGALGSGPPEAGSQTAPGSPGQGGDVVEAGAGGSAEVQPGSLADPAAIGPDSVREFERIYAPGATGDGGTGGVTQVQGRAVGEGEGTPLGQVPTPQEAAGSGPITRPYTEVLGEYTEQAGQAMQRANLDPAVQDLVRQYFAGLEPGDDADGGR